MKLCVFVEYVEWNYKYLLNTWNETVRICVEYVEWNYKCSVSRWRPQKVDKRMVLEYTHGLFIT